MQSELPIHVSFIGLGCVAMAVLLMVGLVIAGIILIIRLGAGDKVAAKLLATFAGVCGVGLLFLVLLGGWLFSVRAVRSVQVSEKLNEATAARIEQENQDNMRRQFEIQRPPMPVEPSRIQLPQPPLPPSAPVPEVPPLVPSEKVSTVTESLLTPAVASAEPLSQSDTPPVTPIPEKTPDWVTKSPQQALPAFDVLARKPTTVAVGSKPYASVQEADAEARQAVCELIARDVDVFARQSVVRARRLDVPAAIIEAAIRDRFVESKQHDFGSFTAPMYRVWYQIELSPQSRMTALQHLRQSTAMARLQFVGFVLAALFSIPFAVLVRGWVAHGWSGRSRRAAGWVTATVLVGAWIAAWLGIVAPMIRIG